MPVKTQEVSTTNAKRVSYAELSVIYDRIYDIADRLFKKHNPCNIQVKDNKAKCVNKHYEYNYLCCRCYDNRCKHWQNGCTEKCLSCKLFVCGYILYTYDKNNIQGRNKKYITFVNKIRRLKRIANRHGFSNMDYYLTKKIVLKRLLGDKI